MSVPFGDGMEDEIADMMDDLAGAMERAAPQLAAAYWCLFSELRDQGFTEEQAMRIVCEFHATPQVE